MSERKNFNKMNGDEKEEAMRQAWGGIKEALSEKFYWDCQIGGKYSGIPAVKKGKETRVFKNGEVVETTATSGIKEGTRLVIESSEKVNGYWRYYAGGMGHRTQDLKKVKKES